MTETRNVGQDVQAEILKTVRRSQEAVIEAIKTWADTVRSITLPLPEMNVPFSDKMPKPEELIENAYDFAEKMLANQRKFAEDVLHATEALLPGSSDTAKKNGAAK
jgi:hypothetical protein